MDRGIDLRVLQYGATPQRLKDALGEDEGWDVVHFSGHGAPGVLVLEDPSGQPVRVETDELVEWLWGARHRLKLVSLSACSSAAFTVAETLRLMGVDVAEPDEAGETLQVGGLATEIVERARCAVVAMRYPVVDDFAIELAEAFLAALWVKGQPVDGALGVALAELAGRPAAAGAPPLSTLTPAVFGAAAVGLRLAPPALTTSVDVRMAGFDARAGPVRGQGGGDDFARTPSWLVRVAAAG